MYKPLRKKILEAMDGNDWIDVDRRKRELHKQYLEFTNAKVTRPLGYKTFFMLNSAEHKIYPAHKC